ncbi:MAG: hypothetical protein HGA19_10705 [Oscillochloris sp.]|nr:hypothetical protein [Oscillochloris sp.]
METSSRASGSPQPEVPNAARIYNYTLGGSHTFPVDQAAAEYMFSLVPSTPKWVRMLRAFLQQAARQLWAEGYTHFVDFASGLPTDDHIHHVLPNAKVVYSDLDLDTYAQAHTLVSQFSNVLYLNHDVRDARSLLESSEVRAFLGNERRVVFGLNGITVFLSPDEISRLFHDLYAWAAPGTKIYITYETKLPGLMTPQMEQFIDMFRQAGSPFWLYSLEECITLSQPWQLPAAGLVPLREFLGLPPDYITEVDHEAVGLEFYAAILEKP